MTPWLPLRVTGLFLLVSLPAFAQYMLPDSLRAQQLLVRSLTYLEMDQPDEAIPLLEEALSLVPEAPALMSLLAQAYRQQHDLSAARFYAEKACRAAPREVSYCHEWLEVLEAAGATSALQQAVRFVQQHHPEDPRVLRYQAQWAYQRGDLLTARRLYEALQERNRTDTSLYRTLWPLQLATGDSLAALHTLETLLSFDAANAHLWRTLGRLYLHYKQLSKARWALERALQLAPRDTLATRLLAHLTMHSSTPTALLARARQRIQQQPLTPEALQEARALLQEVLRRDSTHVEALRLLAQLYQAQRPDWSAELLTRSLAYDPGHLPTWITAARTWLLAGLPRRSARVAEEGLFLFPDQLPLLRLAAYAYLALGRPDTALSYAEQFLQLLPEWPEHPPEVAAELWALKGHLSARLQHFEAAREACRQARRQARRSVSVRLHCAVVDWLADGRTDAVLQKGQAALPAQPEPWMLETLGWLYLQTAQPERARAVLRRVLQTGYAGPLTYAYLGEALAQLGHLDEARRIWQEALRRDPSNPYLQHLLTIY
ncbi:tetratricopeptide repeat protein [Rhodothermus profundi]|uniref:Tetratricopeptide repeat-containing protein n=1 Tax=Rhodothermus profundi TaxID=633813 RepID=A0A1M6WT01_9BACT|nr:tetratricopeptide repeat protein [Rhodothermus profundi]SHK96900.1 Tetratricopeptide repeat-containing protein [Rhodothermus profundi]